MADTALNPEKYTVPFYADNFSDEQIGKWFLVVPTQGPSFVLKFLGKDYYFLRFLHEDTNTTEFVRPNEVTFYRPKTVDERNASIESIVNEPSEPKNLLRKPVMNWMLKTTGASTKKTRRLQRRGKNKRTRRH